MPHSVVAGARGFGLEDLISGQWQQKEQERQADTHTHGHVHLSSRLLAGSLPFHR